eukprot:9077249-Alexandrium_andersonii.AAC.1
MATSKYPLNVVAMQTADLLHRRRLWLNLDWQPREKNVLADQLSNENFEGFDPARRIALEWSTELMEERYPVLAKFLAQ